MSTSTPPKLTKFVPGTTILRADYINLMYGGLYDSDEGAEYVAGDPAIAGHIHDGQHLDGHAQKIDLVQHVTGQLNNINIGDDQVNVRNIASYTEQSSAIPERDGTKYYLDLSDIRSEITGLSESVSDIPFIVQESEAIVTKSAYSGYNLSFGVENTVGNLSNSSVIFGGGVYDDETVEENIISDSFSSGILCGTDNYIKGNSDAIVGGRSNEIRSRIEKGNNIIGAGRNNEISNSLNSAIVSGNGNSVSKDKSFIGAGSGNTIDGKFSAIMAGKNNSVSGLKSIICGGEQNVVDNDFALIVGGYANEITDGTGSDGEYSVILGGRNNQVKDKYAAVLGGRNNQAKGRYSSVLGGRNNIANSYAGIVMGQYAVARSYGERAYSNGGFDDSPGTSQEVTYIFRTTIDPTSTDDYIDLFLNGSSAKAESLSGTRLYLTCELLIAGINADDSSALSYGIKKTILVENIGGTLSFTAAAASSDEIKSLPAIPSWDIELLSSGEDWYVRATKDNLAFNIDGRATCICRGVLVRETTPSAPSGTSIDFNRSDDTNIFDFEVRAGDYPVTNITWSVYEGAVLTDSFVGEDFGYTFPEVAAGDPKRTYDVIAQVINPTGIETISEIIEIDPQPAPSPAFTADNFTGTAPYTATIEDQSANFDGVVEWDLDNDGIFETSGSTVTKSFATAGTYPVTVKTGSVIKTRTFKPK